VTQIEICNVHIIPIGPLCSDDDEEEEEEEEEEVDPGKKPPALDHREALDEL